MTSPRPLFQFLKFLSRFSFMQSRKSPIQPGIEGYFDCMTGRWVEDAIEGRALAMREIQDPAVRYNFRYDPPCQVFFPHTMALLRTDSSNVMSVEDQLRRLSPAPSPDRHHVEGVHRSEPPLAGWMRRQPSVDTPKPVETFQQYNERIHEEALQALAAASPHLREVIFPSPQLKPPKPKRQTPAPSLPPPASSSVPRTASPIEVSPSAAKPSTVTLRLVETSPANDEEGAETFYNKQSNPFLPLTPENRDDLCRTVNLVEIIEEHLDSEEVAGSLPACCVENCLDPGIQWFNLTLRFRKYICIKHMERWEGSVTARCAVSESEKRAEFLRWVKALSKGQVPRRPLPHYGHGFPTTEKPR